jgi:hypothetical protein
MRRGIPTGTLARATEGKSKGRPAKAGPRAASARTAVLNNLLVARSTVSLALQDFDAARVSSAYRQDLDEALAVLTRVLEAVMAEQDRDRGLR